MLRLSLADRHQAIGMSQDEVAAHFQCHRNTISALVRRQRERNDVTDRPRSGPILETFPISEAQRIIASEIVPILEMTRISSMKNPCLRGRTKYNWDLNPSQVTGTQPFHYITLTAQQRDSTAPTTLIHVRQKQLLYSASHFTLICLHHTHRLLKLLGKLSQLFIINGNSSISIKNVHSFS
jgi:hypothetical protein